MAGVRVRVWECEGRGEEGRWEMKRVDSDCESQLRPGVGFGFGFGFLKKIVFKFFFFLSGISINYIYGRLLFSEG